MKHILSLFSFLVFACSNILGEETGFFIVAPDGSGSHQTIQAAIDDAPEAIRTFIFIKNGTYKEYVSVGSKNNSTSKKISLIGESRDGVVITSDKNREDNGLTFEDITTLKVYAKDFYAENLTIENTAGSGRSEALYTHADRYTFQNVRLLSTQDTYKSNDATRGYFRNSLIQGTVDFIYGGGTIFFDDCTISCIHGGGYITAPSEASVLIKRTLTEAGIFLRVGFIFRNCDITANSDVKENSYYLGRPWKERCGSAFLQCRLGNHIHPAGWKEWNGSETSATMGEYLNTDAAGNLLKTDNRATWSYQFLKNDVERYLTPEYIYGVLNASEAYNPEKLCLTPAKPTNFQITDDLLLWDSMEDAAGYLIYKNGKLVTAVNASTTLFPIMERGVYSLRSFSQNGALGPIAEVATGIQTVQSDRLHITVCDHTLTLSEKANISLFSITGKLLVSENNTENISLQGIPAGIVIAKVICLDGTISVQKILIK